jgi:hypothetical protein
MALEVAMGKNGVNALVMLANLPQFANGSYPPDDLERQFDIAYLSLLCDALEYMGGRGLGRGIALRAGKSMFLHDLPQWFDVVPALKIREEAAFRALAFDEQIETALKALDELITSFAPQRRAIIEKTDHFYYTLPQCPACYGRRADTRPSGLGLDKLPLCGAIRGMLESGLEWFTGMTFTVKEIECHAHGKPHCQFAIALGSTS